MTSMSWCALGGLIISTSYAGQPSGTATASALVTMNDAAKTAREYAAYRAQFAVFKKSVPFVGVPQLNPQPLLP
jgi:hypothetical protein